MQKFIILYLILTLSAIPNAMGEINVRVCTADGNTPMVYSDIMVGTHLTFIVSSDTTAYWYGTFAIYDANRNYGALYGRDFDGFAYPGSCFLAAGNEAWVYDWAGFLFGKEGIFFEMEIGETNVKTGDWFIIDYNAINVGTCKVEFSEYFAEIPTKILSFTHVRTRDLDNDTIVNFKDFSIFSSKWQNSNCSGPGWCMGADLDTNGTVDVKDLMLFSDYWLEKTQ